MAEDTEEDDRLIKAHRVFVRLVLPPYTIHFKSPGYMKDATMDMLDNRVCKETLRLTAQHARIRQVIGTDCKFWSEMVLVFRAAIPSLERRSFSVWDPSSVDYESTSSVLIATHYPTLWKDLDRLNDLVSIARNVITKSSMAQDLASGCVFEEEVFRLVNCCVRVTARGYDGDAGTGDEEKWQWIVGSYKRLLITSLQFLNNLVARNERRKLMLWVSLFDNLTDNHMPDDLDSNGAPSQLGPTMPEPPVSTSDILVALGETSQPRVDAAADALRAKRLLAPKGQPRPSRPVSGYVLFVKWHTNRVMTELGPSASPADVAVELSQQWSRIPESHRKEWSLRYDELMAQYDKDLEEYNDARRMNAAKNSQIDQVAIRIAHIEEQLSDSMAKDVPHVAPLDLPLENENGPQSLASGETPRGVTADDFKMLFTAAAGARILETGKSELLKRLDTALVEGPSEDVYVDEEDDVDEEYLAFMGGDVAPVQPEQATDARKGATDGHAELESELEESEDEEYSASTEDGRGLLTDVPLILGPSEIEVLPMIIMSGIVPPPKSSIDSQEDYNAVVNMHTVRCHLLLAQDNGKNLLRELLIFVAAWDLRDEELYFKFMLKIMEAILINGLMPYAYHAFRDKSRSKDIISPAQAVIMKLLTNIFRARAENARMAQGSPDAPKYPGRVDVHIVNFIFTEFRQHIIPQTCALIFLQGKIHQGLAHPADFPLNLWDMERMYEGVYQYLEFFAVLTEEQTWKDVMAEWEVSSELVTMLRELEVAIPKSNAGGNILPTATAAASHTRRAVSVDTGRGALRSPTRQDSYHMGSPRMAGHDLLATTTTTMTIDAQAQHPNLPASASDPNTPVPAQIVSHIPPTTVTSTLEGGNGADVAYAEEPQDEPSDFEWRNLKKLTVLVLSSLIWKNRTVQDQVREHGGLEALVGCCKHDEHNPYIREHAIMCLRFAVEGNADNAEVIRRMAGQSQAQIDGQVQVQIVRDQPQEGTQDQSLQKTHAGVDGARDDAYETSDPGSPVSIHSSPPTTTATAGTTFSTGAVPKEVLDTQCYETFMDGKGQVGLRRKQQISALSSLSSSLPSPSNRMPGMSGGHQPAMLSMQAAAAVRAVQDAMTDMEAAGGAVAAAAAAVASAAGGPATATQTSTGTTGTVEESAYTQNARTSTNKVAAERAAEIMQTALRELPLSTAIESGNRDIIAQLNRTALEPEDEVAVEAAEFEGEAAVEDESGSGIGSETMTRSA